ncbi:hypothetical protein NQZ68_036697 [Dissostichus eleginoides]|nr:hypothetical protein NQZ68_036697 [Dissostichus eleginoides]
MACRSCLQPRFSSVTCGMPVNDKKGGCEDPSCSSAGARQIDDDLIAASEDHKQHWPHKAKSKRGYSQNAFHSARQPIAVEELCSRYGRSWFVSPPRNPIQLLPYLEHNSSTVRAVIKSEDSTGPGRQADNEDEQWSVLIKEMKACEPWQAVGVSGAGVRCFRFPHGSDLLFLRASCQNADPHNPHCRQQLP